MAQAKEKFVTLYAPGGTEVEVNEARGEVLKSRGYTTKPPRVAAKTSRKPSGDESARIADLEAQLAKAQQERDEALEAATAAKTETK